MLRSLLLLTLLALPISCGANSPVPVSPRPCVVPAAPPDPDIAPFVCEDGVNVCLTVEDTAELAAWIHGMQEVERAVAACSLVTRG